MYIYIYIFFFFFQQHITDNSSYIHVQTAIFDHLVSTRMKEKPLEENTLFPHIETNIRLSFHF